MINVLLCDGFFDCASVLTKSIAEVTFSLAYIFVALYHINEVGRGASDVMSYASLFVGRVKPTRRSSLSNERTGLALISVNNGKLQNPGRGGGGHRTRFKDKAHHRP